MQFCIWKWHCICFVLWEVFVLPEDLLQWQNREICAFWKCFDRKKRLYNNMAFPLQFQAFYSERICLSCVVLMMMMIWTFSLAQKGFFFSIFLLLLWADLAVTVMFKDMQQATTKQKCNNNQVSSSFPTIVCFRFKFTINEE